MTQVCSFFFFLLSSFADLQPLDHHFTSTIGQFDVLAQVTMFLAVVCTVLMGISRRDGDFLLGLLQIVLTLAFQPLDGRMMRPQHQDILTQIPDSIRTALSKFDLDAKTTTYAACPACHCTYEPQFRNGSTDPVYPANCTNKETPESEECGEQLCRKDGQDANAAKPIKPYVYHSFHDYLAGLLSRKDLEELMDRSCDDLMASLPDPPLTMTTDVWEAQFLRAFEGPTPRTLFVDRQGEGRYGFALNYDSFNVEGMRVRGASTSTGLISMACLNLPPEIRYKPENMYCLIIPGPKSPSLTQLNHYFRPLVSDMVVAWDKGVRFSRTALHPTGRTTRSAIIMGVMDLPAARHASQLAPPTSHYYCSVCKCWHKSTLSRTDYENWEERDNVEIRQFAFDWLDASSSKDRKSIFESHGTRWSELWRLPYWNPSRQLVVDAMHCILEGLAQNHFRYTLCLTTTEATASAPQPPAFTHKFRQVDRDQSSLSSNDIKHVSLIHQLLTAALEGVGDDGTITDASVRDGSLSTLRKRLTQKNLQALQFVCRDLDIQPQAEGSTAISGSPVRFYKNDWARALVQWVCGFIVSFIRL